jgi:transcriptional regulator with XRE-family HTH domain
MTQSELAQKAGMTAMHVSHFECGRRLPSLENFAALMRVLGGHSEYLLELEGEHQHAIQLKGSGWK